MMKSHLPGLWRQGWVGAVTKVWATTANALCACKENQHNDQELDIPSNTIIIEDAFETYWVIVSDCVSSG